MADNVVGNLLVNLGINTARVKTDVNQAKGHFDKFGRSSEKSLNRVKRSAGGLSKSIGSLSGIMGTLSVAGLGLLAKNALDAADKVQKLSIRLGASTEALSQYQHVADLSGVQFNTLAKSWQFMTNQISDATTGIGDGKKALAELNLSATDLNNLKPEDQFEAIADALSGVKTSSDQTRLAMDLFGGRGVELLQIVNAGTEGIKSMRDEADQLGLTLTRADADAAALANDSMTQLGAAMRGVTQELTLGLAPQLSKIIRQIGIGIPIVINSLKEAFGTDARSQLRDATEEMNRLVLAHKEYSDILDESRRKGADPLALLGQERALNGIKNSLTEARTKVEELIAFNSQIPAIDINQFGGGEDDGNQQLLTSKLDRLTSSLMDEEERLKQSYANRQLIVEDAFAAHLIDEERRKELLLQLESDYQRKMKTIEKKSWTDRQKFDAMSGKQKTKTVVGEMVNLTAGVAKESRKLFEINKAAGIANAIVSTYEGVSKTLSAFPYPIAIPLAALHLAAGLAQVSAIKNQSFSGGGGGGGIAPSSAGTIPASQVPANPIPDQSANENEGAAIIINIEGNLYHNDDFRQTLVETIRDATENDELIIRNAN